jgi:hypothetical protein
MSDYEPESRLIPVEVQVAWGPDGVPRVLLQIPDGYLLTTAEAARTVAAMLWDTAAECDDVT